ncbi:hypothetical protein Pta02_11750 [Planobispora takensis]|uniref:Uncharacterized protein n=2 Tax=Planobispora takensis TaxID=1367882 RepID=A0A8J3WTR5_9ACTN|nr:hypothetical protein Pta02_11750 [Planobispora takensis]
MFGCRQAHRRMRIPEFHTLLVLYWLTVMHDLQAALKGAVSKAALEHLPF